MLIHPEINPVALQLGPLAIHWYGLTYLAAFGLFFFLATLRLRHQPYASITGPGAWARRDIEDILFLGVMGVVIGGRLGYCLFYKPAYYAAHPLEIFYVWQGGMSFHGGFLGVLIAMYLFNKKHKQPWLKIMDFVAPLVPIGLGAGRMGNFINGELWGRATNSSFGMIFPQVDKLARHPSQLYEFALEGIALFCILWWFSRKQQPVGAISALFLIGYGSFRFLVEYTRQPDEFLGLLQLGMSMGQWLSLPMVLIGIWMWVSAHKNRFN